MAAPNSPDLLDHQEPWTEQAYLALPGAYRRVELLDGGLLVSPSPGGRHQRLSFQLCHAMARAVDADLEVLEAINVRVAPGKILIPDLVVVTDPGADDIVSDAAQVAMVVEIVSPGSAAADRAVRPQLYARGGIPHYLRVELGRPGVSAVAYRLVGGYYVPGRAGRARRAAAIDRTVPARRRPDSAGRRHPVARLSAQRRGESGCSSRASGMPSSSLSGSSGSGNPARSASSCAATATPASSATPVTLAHNRSAMTAVSGP